MEKRRILIIDDEAGFTRMVKINLEKTEQFEVLEENRAGHALQAARDYRPDLILLDVIMPSMDGGDVFANLRKDRHLKKVPIIFLTATVSQREAGPAGLNSGGSLFLAKPVSTEVLIQRILEHLPAQKAPESPSPEAPTPAQNPAPEKKSDA